MIFGSAQLGTLSKRTRVPVVGLLVAGAVPALIAIAGLFLEEMIKTIIVFGSAGIYVAFQMIVLGALIARAKGWRPSGEFRLGVWAWPVNLAALAYGVLAIINMVWPRTPQDPWYRNYGMIVGTVAVVGSGLLYAILFRPYDRLDAPEGDAHLAHLGREVG
jgi:amino acid transporter